MKQINILVAVDAEWGIGHENDLLFHLKKDMKFFRNKTVGNIVVMGRRTFHSLPGESPLPERINIVLTRDEAEKRRLLERWENDKREEKAELIVCTSPEEVFAYLENKKEDVYVIGGEEIYRLFLKHASVAYVTKVDALRKADRFFPDLEKLPEWEKTSVSEAMQDESGVEFEFICYQRC